MPSMRSAWTSAMRRYCKELSVPFRFSIVAGLTLPAGSISANCGYRRRARAAARCIYESRLSSNRCRLMSISVWAAIAQFAIAITGSVKLTPSGVSSYSVRGGTSG